MASWTLSNADHTMVVDLQAGDSGSLAGTLTCAGKSYPVSGGWSASGSVPGRNYSVFSLSGRTQGLPDVPDWIAAVGVMTGPGAAPQRIDIRVTVSSSTNGTLQQYNGVLTPSGVPASHDLSDFRGVYRTSIEALGMHNPSLSPLVIYDDGSTYVYDTEVQAQFDGISTLTLPPFTINGMDVLRGEVTFNPTDPTRFAGSLTFRDTPWMSRPYVGTAVHLFPRPTLDNTIDATMAFDTGDGFRLQDSGGNWVIATGNVVGATAASKPATWIQVTAATNEAGIALGANGHYWVATDGVVRTSAATLGQATIFTPLLTLEGALLLKSPDGRYVTVRADGTLILAAALSLDAVAQFGGEAQPVAANRLMTRWNVAAAPATVTQCDLDKASLCWQLTGGFFLALGLGPYMAESADPKKLGVMGILRSSPAVWAKVSAVWDGIANNPIISATAAAGLAAEVITLAWHEGLLWKLIKFVLTQAGWWLLFQVFSWILSWVVAPELAVADLLASFITWSLGLINTAVAISHDCGQTFLPSSPATPAAATTT